MLGRPGFYLETTSIGEQPVKVPYSERVATYTAPEYAQGTVSDRRFGELWRFRWDRNRRTRCACCGIAVDAATIARHLDLS